MKSLQFQSNSLPGFLTSPEGQPPLKGRLVGARAYHTPYNNGISINFHLPKDTSLYVRLDDTQARSTVFQLTECREFLVRLGFSALSEPSSTPDSLQYDLQLREAGSQEPSTGEGISATCRSDLGLVVLTAAYSNYPELGSMVAWLPVLHVEALIYDLERALESQREYPRHLR